MGSRKKKIEKEKTRPNHWKKFFVGVGIVLFLVIGVRLGRDTDWGMVMAAGRQKVRGEKQASVVMVEFSDFQCPSCKAAQPVVHELLETYKGKLKLVFKHYPLEVHRWSRMASAAAECAKAQGKFWEFHDALFENQQEWAESDQPEREFRLYGKEIGLDLKLFESCYNDPKTLRPVDKDIAEGDARDVRSTPTFFIGDERIVGGGQLARNGARLIEKALGN